MKYLFATTFVVAAVALSACDDSKKQDEPEGTKVAAKEKADKQPEAKKKADEGKAKAQAEPERAKPAEKPAGTTPAEAAAVPAKPAGVQGGAFAYLPADTKVVISMNMAALATAPEYKEYLATLEAGPAKDAMKAIDDCKIGLEKWKQIVVGVDFEADDKSVTVLSVEGLGNKKTLTCVAGKIKENGGGEIKVGERDGRTVVDIPENKSVLYVVDDNTAVMTTQSWDKETKAQLGGAASGGAQGTLKSALARIDPTKAISFSGGVPAVAGTMLPGAKFLWGSMHWAKGLDLTVDIEFADDATAKGQALELQQKVAAFAPMTAGMGIPPTIMSKVKLQPAGKVVHLGLNINDAEMAALRGALGQAAG